MTLDLFEPAPPRVAIETIDTGVVLLRGYALEASLQLLEGIERIAHEAEFRQMDTPGGFRMSVAMTNCGALGWVTDRTGYRYSATDPQTSRPWPPMPEALLRLSDAASREAGFGAFAPDACLVNRYEAGARMSLHQDRNERDFSAPIVSISLGLPATVLFGGLKRADKTVRVPLQHGDVVVWGGPARMRFHGVAPLKLGSHALTGEYRFNLTLRKAG